MATRPGMYIECTSADSIYSFIQGFYYCRSVHGELDLQDREFAESFYPWLKSRHRLEDAATWGGFISQLASARQATPWDTFIGEFDCFVSRGGCR
jgi:hypothetical protein